MTAAFIGHRKIDDTPELRERVMSIVEELIVRDGVETFLFGSRSEFNDLCYGIVSEIRKTHSYIRRVYVRAEYEHISQAYNDYLLSDYENTFYPKEVHGAGVRSYLKRNAVMIDKCDILVAYFDKSVTGNKKIKSGTRAAVAYAAKIGKRIINLFNA